MFWKKQTEPVPVVVLPDDNHSEAVPIDRPSSPQPSTSQTPQSTKSYEPTAKRMSSDEIMRLEESRRLAQTALETVQQQIDELAEAVHRHNEYVSLAARHDEANADMQAKNKALAAMRADEQLLQRFEACEEALPLYLQLRMAEQQQVDYRGRLAEVKEQERLLTAEAQNAMNTLSAITTTTSEARHQLAVQEEALETGYRIDGQRIAMQAEREAVGDTRVCIEDMRTRYAALVDDLRAQLDDCNARLADARTQYAPLNSNRTLMERAEEELAALDNLYARLKQRAALDKAWRELAVRQRDMNDRLATLYQRDLSLEERLATMQNEIAMHLQQNHGIDGQALQLRVINLRARRQALNAAIRLWAHICSLCEGIEANRAKQRSLQQQIEKSDADIERMQVDVRTLRAESWQRRYDYTVSKGQNVIKLRGDLREGTPCAVCGATTHPFHCDTIAEQNHLIAEWKGEADRLDVDLRNVENALLSEMLSNATRKGTLSTIVETLQRQQTTLSTLTQQWLEYEALDASLRGINPSSMSTACTQTLRGLLEMTLRDEASSTEQLGTYNYHQQQINRIALEIDNVENERTALSASLNQTNTECQVMAAQAEWLKQQLASTDTHYRQIYQQIESIIDITDWHAKWLTSHDNFKLQLGMRASEWRRLGALIEQYDWQQARLQDDIKNCRDIIAECDSLLALLDRRLAAIDEQECHALNQYARLFADSTARDVYRRAHDNMTAAQQQFDEQLSRTLDLNAEAMQVQGAANAYECIATSVAERVSASRAALDEWLYHFRLDGNPPCRLDELDELFKPNNNWSSVRQRIRQCRDAYQLACAIEQEVRTRLLATDDGDDVKQAAARREALVHQRTKHLTTIARIDLLMRNFATQEN